MQLESVNCESSELKMKISALYLRFKNTCVPFNSWQTRCGPSTSKLGIEVTSARLARQFSANLYFILFREVILSFCFPAAL